MRKRESGNTGNNNSPNESSSCRYHYGYCCCGFSSNMNCGCTSCKNSDNKTKNEGTTKIILNDGGIKDQKFAILTTLSMQQKLKDNIIFAPEPQHKVDVVLTTLDSKHLFVHSMILSLRSKMFSMLCHDNEKKELFLDLNSYDALLLVESIYSGELDKLVNETNVLKLYQLSVHYDVRLLSRKCTAFFAETFDEFDRSLDEKLMKKLETKLSFLIQICIELQNNNEIYLLKEYCKLYERILKEGTIDLRKSLLLSPDFPKLNPEIMLHIVTLIADPRD